MPPATFFLSGESARLFGLGDAHLTIPYKVFMDHVHPLDQKGCSTSTMTI